MALIDARFQPWQTVKEQLRAILQTADPQEMCATVPYGIQLLHSMHHPHAVRCLTFYHSTVGDIYVTHIDTGACNEIYVWTVSSMDEHSVKCIKFPIKAAISRMIFIPHHRVFVGFCSDMTLRTFSDLIHQCAELTQVTCLSTVLCMVYNECYDELITGGHGCLRTWKMTHIELRDPLTSGRPIECQITPDDWVRDLQIDKKHKQLVALCDEGVCIVDYLTNKQVFFICNWHETALTSCVFYRHLEYFITAAMDGTIKVWNAIVYSQVHEFIGHYDSVTGLVTHPTDPLLISSSKDGTIRVWRLDTFELTQRLDVGEKILGMRLANPSQLYYYTLHDVKIYTLNQFHHMFTPVRSCIHKLACVKTASSPTRILCAAEDGGVRLISAVSGTILTIIYPMATYQILTDLVYDPKHDTIYTVMATGDVLVFNSATNPCTADQLWVPSLPDECVLCLTLIKLDCALGKPESADCESLIFAGLNSGQVILLESASQHYMKAPLQAHVGQVTGLEHSHGRCSGDGQGIGDADRLVSCGSDKIVCVWSIEFTGSQNLTVKLTCLKMITCSLCPSHMSMLGNSLCMVLPNNVIDIYELVDDAKMSDAGAKDEFITSKTLESFKLHTHLKELNHTLMVTALCSCQPLGLFATTSNDGSIKLWDLTNCLVRELCFDTSLRSVCFANDRGDLLVGFQNHVSYVGITTYLPTSYMEKLLEGRDFEDEEIEEPIRFNPDLQLWFNIADLPTFPTDVILRRRIQQSADHLQRHRLSIAPPRDRGDSSIAPTPADLSRIGSAHRMSPSGSETEVYKSKTRHPLVGLKHAITHAAKLTTREGAIRTQVDEVPGREATPAKDFLLGETAAIVEGDTTAVSEDVTKETELEKIEEEKVEEDYNPWPIAPDGYIPNSVIRSMMGYRHTLEPIPESPWKLKPVPSGIEETSPPPDSESYEHHEPFIWASSSEEEQEMLDYLSLESIQDEAVKSAIFQELGVADMSLMERRQTLEKLHLSRMALPGKVPIPQLEILGEKAKKKGIKKKRKSRGINATETELVKQKIKGASKSGAEPDESEEEEEVVEEDTTLDLFRKIAANDWFPEGVALRVEPVVKTLLDLLDKVPDLQYRPVCEAVIQIYKQLGLSEQLLENVLTKYRGQLKSSRAVVRANTVKTLTAFGLDRRDVILSLLPALDDDESDVRDETIKAVGALAGIEDRSGLMGYLEKIGFMKQYRGHEREVIQELEHRCAADPTHRLILRPSRIQLLVHRKPTTKPEERPPSPLEDLPDILPGSMIHDWLSRYQLELSQWPEDEGIWNDVGIEQLESWQAKLPSRQKKYTPFPRKAPRVTQGKRRVSMKHPPAGKIVSPTKERQLSSSLGSYKTYMPLGIGQRAGGLTFDQSLALTKRRKTLHVELLQAHDETMGLEKARMESTMRMKLHYHQERYEKLVQRERLSRPKSSNLVPHKADLYSYYRKRAQTKESEKYETDDTSEWSEAALKRAKAVIEAFTDMPSQPMHKPHIEFPDSESGVGGSSLLGNSLPQVDQGAEGSSGFFTETDLLGHKTLPERPRSKLTVKNLQRHDMTSEKAKAPMNEDYFSTKAVTSIQIQKNWREFFSLPSVQRRKNQNAALPSHNAPASCCRPIKCIASGVKVDSSHGERGQRLLEEVAMDGQSARKGEGPVEVFYTPVPEKLTIDVKDRSFGVTHYGNMDMIWTSDGPTGDKGQRKVISMTTIPPCPNKERRKMWLQQQMLFPSLYRLRVLDENRRRHRAVVGSKQKFTAPPPLMHGPVSDSSREIEYRWNSPLPVVITNNLNERTSLLKKLSGSRIVEVKKDLCNDALGSGSKTTHIFLPYLPFDIPETPVAPQNSTISHQGSTKLPKIRTTSTRKTHQCMEDIQEITGDSSRHSITIPLQ